MPRLRRLLLCVTTLALLAGSMGMAALAQAEDSGQLRFMHAIPAASAIDIYTDGQLTVTGLNYGTATQYIMVPAGDHMLTVTPTGLTTTLWQQPVTVGTGTVQTLIAAATDPLAFSSYKDDLVPPAQGNTRLSVAHAMSGGPAIDVLQSTGDRFIENLQQGQLWGAADVPANRYELVVVGAGESVENPLVTAEPYGLNAGTSHMLVIYGPGASPSTLLLSAPTSPAEGGGFVRLVHGVAGAPAVDIFLNDTLIAPALEFGTSTEHLALPAGDYTVSVRSGDEELLNASLEVKDGGAGTVVVLGTPAEPSVTLFPDNIAGISSDKALVSVINTIPGDSSVSVSLEDGTSLAEEIGFGEASEATSLDPTKQVPTVTFTIEGQSATIPLPAQTFYGGVYYNAIALSGTAFTPPTLVFAPTSLAQGIASAPGTAVVAVGIVPNTPEPVEIVAAPTTEPVEVQPTAELVQVVTQAPVATPAGPTARVVLNPDANLNLREYPSAEAKNLARIPANTILLVNGREGAPALPEGVTPDPNATPVIDPATLLTDPKEDLDPEATWLNVTYTTPDGGTITGWVNAFYVEVSNTKGDRQRLADLPTVPNNQPGEARNTALTPPPIPKDRVIARVFNLSPDARLNIRRTPETTGERLEGIANDTPTELLGVGLSGEWAFIRYLPTAGGTITGWVSTQYIEYYYNDRKVSLDELAERGLLVTIDDTLETLEDQYRGAVTGGAQVGALPTPNPIKDAFVAQPTALNPDASLNLRRTPDINAEVIAKIPANTAGVIVTGRTIEGDWLQTTFEGQSGWIASQFVTLTFNGVQADVLDIPVASDAVATEAVTPTPTTSP